MRHLVYISIVGIDRVPWGYFRHKLAAERLVRDGDLPWSILRVTQFHQFADRALRAMSRLPALVGDAGILAQPVDPRDVADRIAGRIAAGPSMTIDEFGGPEVLHLDDAVAQWLNAHSKRRPVWHLRIPGQLGRAFRAGYLTTTARPAGQVTWRDYLAKTAACIPDARRPWGPGAGKGSQVI